MFVLGVITLSDRNFLSELTGSNLLTGACYALVISSAIVCLLALFGCFGAVKEIKCMLLTVSYELFVAAYCVTTKARVRVKSQFSCLEFHSHAHTKVSAAEFFNDLSKIHNNNWLVPQARIRVSVWISRLA